MQHARKLSRRALRDRMGEFLVEGPVAVTEALAAGIELSDLFVTEDAAPIESFSGSPLRVTEQVMRAISDAVTPQGVVGIARIPETNVGDLVEGDLVLVLAEVRDPGNAGTLVRSAAGAGAAGIVFTEGCVDPYSAKTVRSSAGTILRSKVVRDAEVAYALGALREAGFTVLGTAADAPAADSLDLTGRIALVLGNEAWGLPPDVQDLLDDRIGIPMPGPVDSLNVAVAGSILLFECVRQRRSPA